MKKCYYPEIAISLSMLFLVGCRECQLTDEYLLTDLQKDQIPFNGYEEILFNDGGNHVNFYGSGIIDTAEVDYAYPSSCDWYTKESFQIIYSGDYGYIVFTLSGKYGFHINFRDSTFNFSSSLEIDPKTGEFSEYNELIDSLTINYLNYYNLYKDTLIDITYPNGAPDSLRHPIDLYYSTDYGIVKVDFSDGSTWELEEIVW